MAGTWQCALLSGPSFSNVPCKGESGYTVFELGGLIQQWTICSNRKAACPPGPLFTISGATSSMTSKVRIHARAVMGVEKGFKIPFLDPGGWRDNMIIEADPGLPRIDETLTKVTYSGESEVTEDSRLEKGQAGASISVGTGVATNVERRKERQRLLWEEFFSDTSKWYDNRLHKENPQRPDFRHKTKNQALWINNWFKPSWVEERLATVTDQLPPRDVSPIGSINSPTQDAKELEHLCQEGQLTKAMDAFHLLDKGVVPSLHVYSCLLQACSNMKALSEGREVHTHLIKNGLELDPSLSELLVHMFVKCGSLPDALTAFNKLPRRTAFSWTAVILGYTELGQAREALKLYKEMQKEGVEPTKYTFVSVSRACGLLADLQEGRKIHAHVVKSGWECEMFVSASLVDMYAKCGSMLHAQRLFDKQPRHGVVLWSTMIAGYAQQGQPEKALQLYIQMEETSVTPNERTFVSVLKSCGNLALLEAKVAESGQSLNLSALPMGKAIHAEVVRRGFQCNAYVAASLVNMYVKCGSMSDAHCVLESLSGHSVVCWNALIWGYLQQEYSQKALQLYMQMQECDVSPDDRTFVGVLKACGMIAVMEESVFYGQVAKVASLQIGKTIHAEVTLRGCDLNLFVGNTLIDMYAKCGSILDASNVFDTLQQQDVVSWNAIIEAYAQQEQGEKALQYYAEMREAGVKPDDRTFVSVLKAHTSLSAVEEEMILSEQSVKVHALVQGRDIHIEIAKTGYSEDVFVGNSLIHMYSNCGSTDAARSVFDKMPGRNVVSWNSMIAGYAQQEQGDKALQLYVQMKERGVAPNEATFVCILKACSSVGALKTCFAIHRDILHWGCERCASVARSLIHAYGKCGSMVDSHLVFNSLSQHDVVSWTTIIAGYARLGECELSLHSFKQMEEAGMKPDAVTFVSVLAACSHAGWVEEGLIMFRSMSTDFGITATTSHFASLVDLLGRAGLLSKAERLITAMPMESTLPVWFAMLSACRKYINVELGRRAFEHAVRLAPKKGAAYVLMSNIYAHAEMWDEAKQIEEARGRASAWKKTGQSWIEHGDKVRTFLVGDKSHQQTPQVYAKLKELSAQIEIWGLC